MSTQELAIWSMALGAVATVALARLADLSARPSLYDAQRMAEAARGMRSRAAILDPATGEVVPVEQANLGPHRHRRARRSARGVTPRPPGRRQRVYTCERNYFRVRPS